MSDSIRAHLAASRAFIRLFRKYTAGDVMNPGDACYIVVIAEIRGVLNGDKKLTQFHPIWQEFDKLGLPYRSDALNEVARQLLPEVFNSE